MTKIPTENMYYYDPDELEDLGYEGGLSKLGFWLMVILIVVCVIYQANT